MVSLLEIEIIVWGISYLGSWTWTLRVRAGLSGGQ